MICGDTMLFGYEQSIINDINEKLFKEVIFSMLNIHNFLFTIICSKLPYYNNINNVLYFINTEEVTSSRICKFLIFDTI